MKEFELKTLIFNDGDKFRSFQSEDFNFILDKKTGLSICYGETPEQTPTYDPLSPEIIDIYIDKNFKFDKELKNINVIFNINTEKNNELITISTISTVNLIIDSIYDENISDIIKFHEYLNNFNIFTSLVVQYNEDFELRDVTRLKLFNIPNVIFKVNDFKSNKLLDQTNLFLSKNINVSFDFYISKNNYEEFISLINSGFPGNTFSNIIFKDKTSKNIKNKIIEVIDKKGNFTICNTKNDNNEKIKYDSISLYQDGLFKCYLSFKDRKIYYSSDFINGFPFKKIKTLNSYWHSKEFEDWRNSLIDDKYEKIEIKEEK